MRELDILLERYLLQYYENSTDAQKAAFHDLLGMSDPEIANYLLKGEPNPEPVVADVINRILGPA